jgi:hypothetical protein
MKIAMALEKTDVRAGAEMLGLELARLRIRRSSPKRCHGERFQKRLFNGIATCALLVVENGHRGRDC